MTYLYQLVQILYWLLLCSWLGGMIFVSLAAPVVFRVMGRLNVRLPNLQSPALSDDHGTIISGEIVGGLLARMAQIQMVCACLLLPLMLAQFLMIDLSGANFSAAITRFVLWLIAVILLAYEWRSHYRKTWQLRRDYLENADVAEKADDARRAFEREQRRSETLFQVTVFCLIGMVMFSATLSPRVRHTIPSAAPAAPTAPAER